MNAYFSGRMNLPRIRIELTYGEETDMEGAYNVLATLLKDDCVIVVDVTGTPTNRDFVIEKCSSEKMQALVQNSLEGLSYDLYADCPDPVANEDECDVYKEKLQNVFFLGIPCTGGDYNEHAVTCRESGISAVSEALIRLATAFTGST